MKKTLFRKVLAMIMILCLVPTWGAAAWADSPVDVHGEGNEENRESVDVTSSTNISATAVTAGEGATANIAGDVTATNNGGASGGAAIGATAVGSAGTTATVNVGGDVTASSNSSSSTASGAIGVSSDSRTGTADIYVGGDVSATSESAESTGNAIGVYALVGHSGAGTSNVTVDGTVSASTEGSGDASGITASDMSSGAIEISTGDVEASASGTGDVIGVRTSNNFAPIDITTGDIEAENTGSGTAVGIEMFASGNTVSVTSGNVEVEAEKSNEPDSDPDAIGIKVSSDHDGTNAVINVDALESEAEVGTTHGVDIKSSGASSIDVTVNGPMTVTGVEYAQGVSMKVETGSTVNLTVNDDVTVEAEGGAYGPGNGMYIKMGGGEATIVVNGDVASSGSGIQVAGDTGLVDVTIDGDLDAATTGLSIEDNADVSFLITESIKAGEIGIEIGNTVTTDNLEVTVWQIDTNKVNGEDHVAVEGADKKVTEASRKLEENINYIIKINPSQESMITLSGTQVTEKDGKKYNVANMNDKVAMKVNVPSGYQVTGAYGDQGEKLPLKRDASGNYYIIVPMGGGVYLSAVLSQIMSGGGGGSTSVEDIGFYSSYVGNLSYVTITFELNEGRTLSGNPGPIIKSVPAGTWVRLLDAPLKTGSSFELWHTDDPSIKVSQPNESFCAMGDVTFTAKWLGEELPYKMTADETKLVSTLSAASMIPVVEEPAAEVTAAEETEPVAEEAPVVDEAPVVEEAVPVEAATVAETLPVEPVAAEVPVDTAPASESSMMIEAMTTLTAATEALQAATEALIANTSAATGEAGAEEAPPAEEVRPATEEASTAVDEAREELQRITEELEAAKSELKATTEELNSAKSELKTTTVELNAAKDELKATTDELAEAKEALRTGAEELTAAREEFLLLLAELKAQVTPSAEAEEELSSAAEVEEGTPSADIEEEKVPAEETAVADDGGTAETAPSAAEEATAEEESVKS